MKVCRPRSSAQGNVSELSGNDAITGEDVLRGFSCPVADFFA